MVRDKASGALVPAEMETFKAFMPELFAGSVEVEIEAFSPLIDSSDIGPDSWEKMARIVYDRYEEYDEFSLEPKTKLNRTLDELKNSWIAQEKTPCIFISAINKTGLEKLRHDIYKMVAEIHAGRYPFNNFLF